MGHNSQIEFIIDLHIELTSWRLCFFLDIISWPKDKTCP